MLTEIAQKCNIRKTEFTEESLPLRRSDELAVSAAPRRPYVEALNVEPYCGLTVASLG